MGILESSQVSRSLCKGTIGDHLDKRPSFGFVEVCGATRHTVERGRRLVVVIVVEVRQAAISSDELDACLRLHLLLRLLLHPFPVSGPVAVRR